MKTDKVYSDWVENNFRESPHTIGLWYRKNISNANPIAGFELNTIYKKEKNENK